MLSTAVAWQSKILLAQGSLLLRQTKQDQITAYIATVDAGYCVHSWQCPRKSCIQKR